MRSLAAIVPLLLLAGCYNVAGLTPDSGDEALDAGPEGELPDPVDVACGDLSPCVTSSSSGHTCPGSPVGVQCWNMAGHCNADKLCASADQACSIACGTTSCDEGAGDPPKPICY